MELVSKPAKPDAPAKPASNDSEYDAFEDLARKLVKVPKREIDAERERQARANGSKSD